MDLVYKVDDENGNVVFAAREKALHVAQTYNALENSKSWAEFRAQLPRGGWEEFLVRRADRDDDDNPVDNFPTGCEPFDATIIETGHPEWLANTAISWFPTDLIKKYNGKVEHSPASDDSLYLPADKAQEIAADLRVLGHAVEPSPVDLI